VIFQEFIDPDCEYRVTVINDVLFVARKDTRNSKYKYDTRIDCILRHEAACLPAQVEDQLLRFMEIADIRYGAFDLIFSKAGDFYFIEVNPAGQFLYIEKETGLDISAAMGNALSSTRGQVDINNYHMIGISTMCHENIFANVVEHRVTHIKNDD